jgi:hypothetical protein
MTHIAGGREAVGAGIDPHLFNHFWYWTNGGKVG